MSSDRYLVGIDVGGTFTDILCLDTESQALLTAKVPSLPGRQWEGVLGALEELGIEAGDIRAFVHGTTIATNTLLERKGARTAFITTDGFQRYAGDRPHPPAHRRAVQYKVRQAGAAGRAGAAFRGARTDCRRRRRAHGHRRS